MEALFIPELKEQLKDRRQRLNKAISEIGSTQNLIDLLHSVDAALERMGNGSYGICEVCKEPIEEERLIADPLITVCLSHLSNIQQRILEEDISLASRIQRELLPENDYKIDGWEIYYYYSPAGVVSGDYVDIIANEDNPILFCLGDVSGKGIAASLLMSHLHAMFRSLSSFNLPVNDLLQRANRLLCESMPASHYATLISGKAKANGEIDICNAGHNYPLLLSGDNIRKIKSTGLPVGLFCNAEYGAEKISMEANDILIFYTDGLTESASNGIEYGEERLINLVKNLKSENPQNIVEEILGDLKNFLAGNSSNDDLTLMVLKRTG
jgi:sigma-B regulation protein RsbU (phosphoserine phosphatase)